jgi:hypothetical protein
MFDLALIINELTLMVKYIILATRPMYMPSVFSAIYPIPLTIIYSLIIPIIIHRSLLIDWYHSQQSCRKCYKNLKNDYDQCRHYAYVPITEAVMSGSKCIFLKVLIDNPNYFDYWGAVIDWHFIPTQLHHKCRKNMQKNKIMGNKGPILGPGGNSRGITIGGGNGGGGDTRPP